MYKNLNPRGSRLRIKVPVFRKSGLENLVRLFLCKTDLDNAPMLDPSSKNSTFNENSVRLHIGCGDCNIPGFINVDIKKYSHVHHATGADDLHFAEDQSVDMIYACHVLEHFGRTVFMDVCESGIAF